MSNSTVGRPVKEDNKFVKFVYFPRTTGMCPIPYGNVKGKSHDLTQPVRCDEYFDEIFSLTQTRWEALQGTTYEKWLTISGTLDEAKSKLKADKIKLYPRAGLFKHTKGGK